MKIHKIEVKAEIIIKAVITFGTTNKMDVPITTHNIENNKLMTGTLLFDKRPKLLGASFSTAKPYNIRLVAKTPLFADDTKELAAALFKAQAIDREFLIRMLNPPNRDNMLHALRARMKKEAMAKAMNPQPAQPPRGHKPQAVG